MLLSKLKLFSLNSYQKFKLSIYIKNYIKLFKKFIFLLKFY